MHGYEVMGWLYAAVGHITNVCAPCTNNGDNGCVQTLVIAAPQRHGQQRPTSQHPRVHSPFENRNLRKNANIRGPANKGCRLFDLSLYFDAKPADTASQGASHLEAVAGGGHAVNCADRSRLCEVPQFLRSRGPQAPFGGTSGAAPIVVPTSTNPLATRAGRKAGRAADGMATHSKFRARVAAT